MKIARFIALAGTLVLAAATALPAGRIIYPAPTQARADIAAALRSAAHTHRRVLLDFGGNWCGDCQVLDIYFHNQANLPILQANYILVHVNVGHMDENVDIARRYKIPLQKGVPALAVLDPNGKLIFSQTDGEFEAMGSMQSSAVTSFLVRWKPTKPGCSVVAVNC